MKYKSKAASAYFLMGEDEKALLIAKEVLEDDPFDERSWAIKQVKEPIDKDKIPSSVKDSIVFSLQYSAYSKKLKLNSGNEDVYIKELFRQEKKPDSIDSENINFWFGAAAICLEDISQKHPNNLAHTKPEAYNDNSQLKYSYFILIKINELIVSKNASLESLLFAHMQWVYFYVKYLLSDDKGAVENLYKIYNGIKNEYPALLSGTLVCLSQIGEYKKIVEILTDEELNKNPFLHCIAGVAYLTDNSLEKAFNQLEKYAISINKVTSTEFYNFLSIIDRYYQFKNDPTRFFDKFISQLLFKNEQDRAILKLYAYRFKHEKRDIVKNEIIPLISDFQVLDRDKKFSLISILVSLGEWNRCIELLESYVNKKEESQELELLIIATYLLKKDGEKLLNLLVHWRNYFSPRVDFLFYEIELLQLIPDFERIYEVARFGYSQFSHEYGFLYLKIKALYHLERKEDLSHLLTDQLLGINFNWQVAFEIARICLESDKQVLALELLYKYTNNNRDNPVVKERYVTILASYKIKAVEQESVELGTFLEIGVNSEIQIKEVTKDSLQFDRIVKALSDKRKGEEILIEETSLTDKKIKVKLIAVLDKYIGLWRKIEREISSPNAINDSIKSVNFGVNANIHEISNKLIEEFGADGERRKIITEDAFKKYEKEGLSLTELVIRTNINEPQKIYDFLTSEYGINFRLIPTNIESTLSISNTEEFVLDIFSLLILFDLGINIEDVDTSPFIISQYLPEFFKIELSNINQLDDQPLSLSIDASKVRPILYPDNYKLERGKILTNILTWIEKNCVVKTSPNKVNVLFNEKNITQFDNYYFHYHIDTIFLSNFSGRIIITDDSFIAKNYSHIVKPIGSNSFLKRFIKDYRNKVLKPLIIQMNCTGLSVDKDLLVEEYEKVTGTNTKSGFHKCINNLPFDLNVDHSVIIESLDFIKYLYSRSDLKLDYRRQISQNILIHSLKGHLIDHSFKLRIRRIIRHKFSLLGERVQDVLQDFNYAIDIIST